MTETRKRPYIVRLKLDIIRHPAIYIMLIIIIAYFGVFCYWPMYGNLIAFEEYKPLKGIIGSEYVGLENFVAFFTGHYFWRLVRNTALISFFNLVFGFPIPIIFAILLNEVRHLRYKKLIQTVTYLPHFISTIVICSIIKEFTDTEGFITTIVNSMTSHEGALLADSKCFRAIYVISDIWQSFGWNSILYIAAMSGISQEQYEAAIIDGANKWQQVIHVTLPGIRETIIIMFILACGRIMSVGWEKAFLLQSDVTYETSDIISTYVYRKGFEDSDYSYSTAVNMFNSLINLTLLTIANTVSRKLGDSSLW